MGRDSAVRALQSLGMVVTGNRDVTPFTQRLPCKTSSCLRCNLPPGHTAAPQNKTEMNTMARYTGPTTRINRRFGQAIFTDQGLGVSHTLQASTVRVCVANSATTRSA